MGYQVYFNRRGEPIDAAEADRLLLSMKYRLVARDEVGGTVVSTVWLGVNHQHFDGPPLIFETATFDPEGDVLDRYSTEAEALVGHATVVRRLQDALQPPGEREDVIVPDNDRPIADAEPGSLDISGLDKAELLAALVNAARPGWLLMTHERAAAIIQDRLSAGHGPPFDFDYVAGRAIKCDIGGPRISKLHAARYDSNAGSGTIARVVSELRAAYEKRRAGRHRV